MKVYTPSVTWNISRKGARYRQASALVLSVPKSGRTWFRVMLSKYLSLHFGEQLDIGGYDETSTVLPNILYSHEIWSHRMTSSVRRRLLGFYICPESALLDKPVMVVHRDPRDVLVSLYFHARKRSRRLFQGSIAELVRDKERGAAAMVAVMNAWRERLSGKSDVLWIAYAELHSRPEALLTAAVALLGLDPNPEFVHQAIDFSRFDNMRKLENQGGLGKGFLSPRNAADPESFKVRSGVVGGYGKHLAAEDLIYIDRVLQDLDPFFGYSVSVERDSSPS
ncbi:MAG: sulfotransferase domain-containing protein [Gammaproteobacteria bacterium]|nr:sulfotransferase domain-containing protein [Gammaproteobacteria bacterium]